MEISVNLTELLIQMGLYAENPEELLRPFLIPTFTTQPHLIFQTDSVWLNVPISTEAA